MTAEEDSSRKFNLTIKFNDGAEDISIKCKAVTPFSKIYAAIAKSKGVDPSHFKLLHDGTRLDPEANPKMLEFEEDEQIDYVVTQIGGARS